MNRGDSVKVYAFVGESGSGKSYRAMWVANENNIECIIDDGLLIRGNELLAGSSAKREPTKLGSVRRALFYEKDHAREASSSSVMPSSARACTVIASQRMYSASSAPFSVSTRREL